MVRGTDVACIFIISKLQWSHVFSDMVREHGDEFFLVVGLASMEPCLFRHGKGKKCSKDIYRTNVLQWSHVFSDMVSPDKICPVLLL